MRVFLSTIVLLLGLLLPKGLVQAEIIAPIIPIDPTRAQIETLSGFISQELNRPLDEVVKIVKAVYSQAGLSFPTPVHTLAVIWVESKFDPRAYNPQGPCIGLMQINSGISGQLSRKALIDPETNVHAGLSILRGYRQMTVDDATALVAYNAGPSGKDRICGGKNTHCRSRYSIEVEQVAKRLSAEIGGG